MKKFLLVFLCMSAFCSITKAQSNQWWSHTHVPSGPPLDLGLDYYDFYDFISATDTVHHLEYIAGLKNNSFDTFDNSMFIYNGINYTYFGEYFAGPINDMCVYKGVLYIASAGGVTYDDTDGHIFGFSSLMSYDGESWSYHFIYGAVDALDVIDDTLYVGGTFSQIDSTQYSHVAKYDGQNWYQIPDNPYVNMPNYQTIYCFAKYQGDLYIGGLSPDVNDQEILRYHNGQWGEVGNGLTGLYTRINFLQVYQGDLYAGGIIKQDEGNVADGLVKWDGESWTQVGSGISSYSVWDMKVIDDGLYVSGPFAQAGGINVNGIARWNGAEWCGMHTYTQGQKIPGFFSFNDSIYVPLSNSNTDTLFNYPGLEIYKWIGGQDYGPCSTDAGLGQVTSKDDNIIVSPNPAISTISIQTPNLFSGSISILDLTGKIVMSKRLILSKTSLNLNIGQLSPALYFVRLLSDNGEVFIKKFIKIK